MRPAAASGTAESAAPRFQPRRLWIAFTVGACLALAAWIGILAVTLPQHFTAGHWRGAWVGFDVALLGAFTATAWAVWRRRQMLILCLVVTATLLCCDAWFDLTLDWGTRAFVWSLVSAVCIELPIAAIMIVGARRLLQLTVRTALIRAGGTGPVPPLWQLGLFGPDPGEVTPGERDVGAQAPAPPVRTSPRPASGAGGRTPRGRLQPPRTAEHPESC